MTFERKAELEIRILDKNPQTNLPAPGTEKGRLFIQNLRIIFDIKKSITSASNTANIQTYNLSQEKRAQLNDWGDELRINAGFETNDTNELLFIGEITRTSHLFANPDIITTWDLLEGERNPNQRFLKLSYTGPISVRFMIRDIADKAGLRISEFSPTSDITLKHGWSRSDFVINSIRTLSKSLGLEASLQNGFLRIISNTEGSSKPLQRIDQNNGMVAVPERYTFKKNAIVGIGPKQGWRVKTVLKPNILPGDRIRLVSEKIDLDDILFVDNIRHQGDTHGQQWFSNFELIRIGGQV